MPITIAERLRPFSHIPGTTCVLPLSSLKLQIFPTLIRVYDLANNAQLLQEINVPLQGPVKDFTVQLDLEKAEIRVFGTSREGYFLYTLYAGQNPHEISLKVDKGLSGSTFNHFEKQDPSSIERLSFGGHKSQDFDKFRQSNNLVEILPIWHGLGQLIPHTLPIYQGTAALLKKCQEANKLEFYSAFENLFKAGFDGILCPRLTDEQHQGFELPSVTQEFSPLTLLSEGSKIIRSFFFRQQENHLHILPCLPPQFHAGRYLQINCGHLGILDFEWTKKMIRRVIFHAHETTSIQLHFPKNVHRFRFNNQIQKVDTPIEVIKNQSYHLDNFLK